MEEEIGPGGFHGVLVMVGVGETVDMVIIRPCPIRPAGCMGIFAFRLGISVHRGGARPVSPLPQRGRELNGCG